MATSGQRRDPARLFLRRLGLLVLTGLVFVAASGVWNVYQKERESAALRAQVESEYAELRERETHDFLQTAAWKKLCVSSMRSPKREKDSLLSSSRLRPNPSTRHHPYGSGLRTYSIGGSSSDARFYYIFISSTTTYLRDPSGLCPP